MEESDHRAKVQTPKDPESLENDSGLISGDGATFPSHDDPVELESSYSEREQRFYQ